MANTTLNASGTSAAILNLPTLAQAAGAAGTRYAAIVNGSNVPVKVSGFTLNAGISVISIRYNAHDYEFEQILNRRGGTDFADIVIEEHGTSIIEYTVAGGQSAHTTAGLAIAAGSINTLHNTSSHLAVKRDGTAADNGLYFVNLV